MNKTMLKDLLYIGISYFNISLMASVRFLTSKVGSGIATALAAVYNTNLIPLFVRRFLLSLGIKHGLFSIVRRFLPPDFLKRQINFV